MATSNEQNERIAALIERLAEQPQLLEQVSAWLDSTSSEKAAQPTSEAEPVSAAAQEAGIDDVGRERRHKLLLALRPYLSERRAKALDSFEAVAGVMDLMKHT